MESNYESKRQTGGSNGRREHSIVAAEEADQEVLSQFHSGDGLSMISNTRNGNLTTNSTYQPTRATHVSEERPRNSPESKFKEKFDLENEEELFREDSLETLRVNRTSNSVNFEE